MNIEKLYEMLLQERRELNASLSGAIAAWSANEKQKNRFGARVTETLDFLGDLRGHDSSSIVLQNGKKLVLKKFDVTRYFNFVVFYDFDYADSSSTKGATVTIEAISPNGNWVVLDSQIIDFAATTFSKIIRFDGPYKQFRIVLLNGDAACSLKAIRSICMEASYVA